MAETVLAESAPERAAPDVVSDGAAFHEADVDAPLRAPEDALVVRLGAYEGPLDVLLDLAKRQKVDLRQVSVLQLADQYLAFVEDARRRDARLAADYLVMASWLTYLKSRLLLPPAPGEEEMPADEVAARLALQLRRLDAMRRAARRLTDRPQLGRDVLARGAPGLREETTTRWRADLWGLLGAYCDVRLRVARARATHAPKAPVVLSVEAARARLAEVLPTLEGWQPLAAAIPDEPVPPASRLASTLSAVLESARDGRTRVRQDHAFGPVLIGRGDE